VCAPHAFGVADQVKKFSGHRGASGLAELEWTRAKFGGAEEMTPVRVRIGVAEAQKIRGSGGAHADAGSKILGHRAVIGCAVALPNSIKIGTLRH
jgi:hypothetical protein